MKIGDKRIITSGLLLGVGLGGFADGIFLHQVLQWHEMVSSVVPPVTVVAIKTNMLYDGLFHVFTWLMTIAGVITLASSVSEPRSLDVARPFGGSLLVGWGMFNVVEGLIDHQILGLHHVHPGAGQVAWDIGFIVVSALVVFVGSRVLVRSVTTPRLRPAA